MDAPATLVWIAPEPADAEQSRALARWAAARGLKLSLPRDERPPTIAVDGRIADDVERLLEHARDAIAARDGDAVDHALDGAESVLRAHPELPQAAWLLAEVERARASRWHRVSPVDVEAANRAWMRAEALDGGRVPGAGELPSSTQAPAATITLDISPSDLIPWLDGESVRKGPIVTRAGPHAVVVTWEGAPVWAAWIETPPGSSSVRVVAPGAPSCSSSDVAHARLGQDSVVAELVQCTRWVAAVPGSRAGAVRVAECEAEHCGPLLDWGGAEPWTVAPPPVRSREGWPAWATWGLVGAGAAIAAGVVLVASGALQPAPTDTRFVDRGIKTQ